MELLLRQALLNKLEWLVLLSISMNQLMVGMMDQQSQESESKQLLSLVHLNISQYKSQISVQARSPKW